MSKLVHFSFSEISCNTLMVNEIVESPGDLLTFRISTLFLRIFNWSLSLEFLAMRSTNKEESCFIKFESSLYCKACVVDWDFMEVRNLLQDYWSVYMSSSIEEEFSNELVALLVFKRVPVDVTGVPFFSQMKKS